MTQQPRLLCERKSQLKSNSAFRLQTREPVFKRLSMLKKNKSNNNLKHPLKTFENISKMALYQKIQGTFFTLFGAILDNLISGLPVSARLTRPEMPCIVT